MLNHCWLECLVCGSQFDLAPLFNGCPRCHDRGKHIPVEVRYDLTRIDSVAPDRGAAGIWRWRALLPRVHSSSITSLAEGGTPMPLLGGGGVGLFLKNETANPTWSWKDRGISVSVSVAREFGFRRISAVSTGNHGVAAAAYAAAAGIECAVFCHADASPLQMALMTLYGARVFRGGRREDMLTRLVARGDWFPASTYCPRDGCANPFGVEGFKTIAFEILADLGGKVPDAVFVPAGSGDGLYGIWKGFRELREAGTTSSVPRMFLCQAAACDPYVRAFRAHSSRLDAVEPAPTAALSIAEPIGGRHALAAVYASGGEAISVSEEEISSAIRFAARRGFAIEPASATGVACALQKGKDVGELTVVIATGAAVKWPETILGDFVQPARLPPDFDCVEELLGSEQFWEMEPLR